MFTLLLSFAYHSVCKTNDSYLDCLWLQHAQAYKLKASFIDCWAIIFCLYQPFKFRSEFEGKIKLGPTSSPKGLQHYETHLLLKKVMRYPLAARNNFKSPCRSFAIHLYFFIAADAHLDMEDQVTWRVSRPHLQTHSRPEVGGWAMAQGLPKI